MKLNPLFSPLFPVNGFATKLFGGMLLSMATGGFAAQTDIADVPLAVKNSVKPNIMFILDNSGSMQWGSVTGLDARQSYPTSLLDYYSNDVNKLYYDPNTRYLPGVNSASFSTAPNGNLLPDAIPGSANPDPYRKPGATSGLVNLKAVCFSASTPPPLPAVGVPPQANCSPTSIPGYANKIAVFAYYYKYKGLGLPVPMMKSNDSGAWVVDLGASTVADYDRFDILDTITSYTRGVNRTDCSLNGAKTATTCTYDQEIQNFANWYSYYRSRILTMKTAMGQAFAPLSEKVRVGFSTINDDSYNANSNGANFLQIEDFDNLKKRAWMERLYTINPWGGTPLQAALKRVGEYYKGSTMGYSGGIGEDDPVQFSCQSNYAILSTDGFWNGVKTSVISVGDVDDTVPVVPVSALTNPPVVGLTQGARWPAPYFEGTSFTIVSNKSDSLADTAAYYWITDLRTSGGNEKNDVPTTKEDPASWQHMVTYTIGLGADGSKPYREDYLTATTGFYARLKAGTDSWPEPKADTNTAIDDLWHAAVNGHGQYFSAKNPTTLRDSLGKILESIGSNEGVGGTPAPSRTSLGKDNVTYLASYDPSSWSGDLRSYEINSATGLVASAPSWSAKTQLDLASVTSRNVVTYGGDATPGGAEKGLPFRPFTDPGGAGSKLTAVQQALLDTTTSPADGADVLAYLRGDKSKEGTNYRVRQNLLGDIVSAGPVVIGIPLMNYNDPGYSAFKASQMPDKLTRVKTVFQGANDGMLHAFRADTGDESWAYIPSFLFDGTSKLRDLTKLISFSHHYYVDSTPTSGDVDFGNTCPDGGCSTTPPTPSLTPKWRTVLVGGLGKGGHGYYALDVTTPTTTSEVDAAKKVLWEFPNKATSAVAGIPLTTTGASGSFTMNINKIGYTFGVPLVVKTKAHGWVALVTSGYNNSGDAGQEGHGYLFVLNVRTGALLHVFDTGVGDATTPSGLAQISAYVPSASTDMTIEYVYGGDLLGNVWRFDLNNADPSQWRLKRLTQLVDSLNKSQPVTTTPRLASVVTAGVEKRFVYIGTGQYLGDSDIPGVSGANSHASQTQTMYGLIDNLSSNPSGASPVISPLRSNLVPQILTTSGSHRTATSNTISTQKGWYVDLPVTGERINTTPLMGLGALIFTSNIPSTNVCLPGGSSWLTILDYKTGGIVEGLTNASVFIGESVASGAFFVQTEDGTVKVGVGVDGKIVIPQSLPGGALKNTQRVSWREARINK